MVLVKYPKVYSYRFLRIQCELRDSSTNLLQHLYRLNPVRDISNRIDTIKKQK